MGNAISPGCLSISGSMVKVIIFYGTTRTLQGKRLAGEIMFEFPDCMVCHADSFFIGQPIPALMFDAQLISGQTYFVLPLDCFPCTTLSASSLAALARGLGSGSKRAPVNLKENPFEYVKGSDGRMLIKVTPEFMIRLMTRGQETCDQTASSDDHGGLCSTPELKKHYDNLVGSKEQVWSPKLETISESKGVSYSPWRCIRLEREHREVETS